MSQRTERRNRQQRRDDGFSLIEVVVAIGLLGTLLVATLPSVVGGIRATAAARNVAQGKSVVQAEIERMRNLPFWVARNAGEFVDVLDRYYPDQVGPTAAPTCGSDRAWTALAADSSGYVTSTAGTARCPWEPQTGAMYRKVVPGTVADGTDGFVLVVNTQFLTDATPPAVVAPPAGWTTKTAVVDRPPARQLKVTVTALRAAGTTQLLTQSTTQISRQQIAVPRIRAQVDVVAVEVGTSVLSDVEVPLDATAGILQIRGATDYASTVDATLSAVAAAVGTGDGLANRGATTTVGAPPTVTAAAKDAGDGALDSTDCQLVCWGGSRTSGLTASATGGLPTVGGPSSPASVELKVPSSGGRSLRLGAGSDATYRPELAINTTGADANLLLRMGSVDSVKSATGPDCSVADSGDGIRVGASGWLTSTNRENGLTVEGCGTGRTAPIALLPTTFAADGLVRVQLAKASTRCTVAGTGHTATAVADYRAVVQVWDDGSGYRTVGTITPTSNDLPASPSAVTLPGGRNLGTWLASWSGLAPGSVVPRQSGGIASVRVPGVVTLLTQPLRKRADGTVEPASSLSLTLGTLSCRVEDRR